MAFGKVEKGVKIRGYINTEFQSNLPSVDEILHNLVKWIHKPYEAIVMDCQ